MNVIEFTPEAQEFAKLLAPLQMDEVYFVSLSARNKYLTQEERDFYSLGRTEMFAREIIKKNEDFEFAFRKLTGHLYARRTNNGKEIPMKAIVCYMNINPSSVLKAVQQFKRELGEAEENLMRKVILNGNTANEMDFEFFKKAKSKLNNAYQRNHSRKVFLDIDIDTKNLAVLIKIIASLTINDARFCTIETRGGFHVLVKSDTVKGNYLWKTIEEAGKMPEADGNEVIFNSNGMVPFPGTYHGEFFVKIRKEYSWLW